MRDPPVAAASGHSKVDEIVVVQKALASTTLCALCACDTFERIM